MSNAASLGPFLVGVALGVAVSGVMWERWSPEPQPACPSCVCRCSVVPPSKASVSPEPSTDDCIDDREYLALVNAPDRYCVFPEGLAGDAEGCETGQMCHPVPHEYWVGICDNTPLLPRCFGGAR